MTFYDKKNDLKAEITFGKVKKRYNSSYADLQTTFNQRYSVKEKLSANLMEHIAVTLILTTSATGTVDSLKPSK